MQLFVHRNEPNRPHISSVTSNFKERETKNQPERHFLFDAAARSSSLYFSAFLYSGASLRRSVWRPVVRLSAAGEGVFTVLAGGPQVLFCRKMTFFVPITIFPAKTTNY